MAFSEVTPIPRHCRLVLNQIVCLYLVGKSIEVILRNHNNNEGNTSLVSPSSLKSKVMAHLFVEFNSSMYTVLSTSVESIGVASGGSFSLAIPRLARYFQ